jgi:hypothetical protein
MAPEMRKFAFRIQTRGGSTVDNLVIHGRDQAEAEHKLRQIYHRCTIVEARPLADAPRTDTSDLESVISLIAEEAKRDDPAA